jgi:hypothetical protein
MKCLISICGILCALFLLSCQGRSYSHVQVSPNYPPGSCQELGQVIGNAQSRDEPREQAINDMKYKTAQLSGDYVRLIAVATHGRAARGMAYKCQ